MSYKTRRSPIVAVIQAYLEKHPRPYKPSKHHRRELVSLASEFAALSANEDVVWTLDPPDPTTYVYLYLDTRYPGRYRYVCPSGKTLVTEYPVFYVGKGVRSRMKSHLKAANDLRLTSHKLRTIRAIRRTTGADPIVLVTGSIASDNLAKALEVDLILGIGRADQGLGPLTNKTDGGDGNLGWEPSAKTRARMNAKAAKRRGKKLSKEHRAKLRAAASHAPKSAEHNRKNSEANKGRPKTGLAAKGHRKTEEHNRKNREAQQRNAERIAVLPDIECDICGKKGRLLLGHFTNCRGPKFRDVPDQRSRSSLPSVFCPHCNAECRGPKFIEHFGNCQHKS